MSDVIHEIIERVVRERLSGVEIVAVKVSDDEDYEGDRIFRVMVVFDPSKGKLDAQKTAGLARHIRSRLQSENAFSHPIFRFVSRKDAKDFNADAA